MSKAKVIGIFGGTGALGSALSRKWSTAGHQIVIGSRNAEKAIAVAEEINTEIGKSSQKSGNQCRNREINSEIGKLIQKSGSQLRNSEFGQMLNLALSALSGKARQRGGGLA